MSEQVGAYKVALADLDAGGGVLSLLNPEGADLIITKIVLDVTTPSTGACTVDAGVGAAATTVYDNLIDGLDVNAAVGVFDNIDDQGTNGQSVLRWESGKYLTISTKTGAAADLVGNAYIGYMRV
ncbi:MAG: hypothetical protein DRI32_00445 [Chloroflexi bacterium]|nr:MAG: hypothetical protein DRI32_00445 [Chloroflexota bacterium]